MPFSDDGERRAGAVTRRSKPDGEAAAIGLLIGSAAPFAFLLALDRVSETVASLVTALNLITDSIEQVLAS